MQIPVQGGEDPPYLRHGGACGAEPGLWGANCLSRQRAWAIRRRWLAGSLPRSALCRVAVDVCSRPRNFSAAGSVGQRAPDLAFSQSAASPPHPFPWASHTWLRRAIGCKQHFIYVPTPLTLTYLIFKLQATPHWHPLGDWCMDSYPPFSFSYPFGSFGEREGERESGRVSLPLLL